MSDIHSTAWIVTNNALWGKLTDIRRREIRAWLRMNGVDPALVPVDSTVILAETAEDFWEILFEEYRRNEHGDIVIDPGDPDRAYVLDCSIPLTIDPPQHWLIPVIEDVA